jgi:HSP20 family protein
MFIRSNRPFNPPVDVIELSDRLLVIVEVAGMTASDFNIALNNRRLTVAGLRERPPLPHTAYHQVEIGYGEFHIELTLPWPADRSTVSAVYKHGFLQIELYRRPVDQVRVVDLNAEEQD